MGTWLTDMSAHNPAGGAHVEKQWDYSSHVVSSSIHLLTFAAFIV